ncbi:hypothetical protein HYW32_02960 [Candidatus Berkelbacteria bacterium]|nr:hypothetical protein [Candidatus Berkelbacteria bacterium]
MLTFGVGLGLIRSAEWCVRNFGTMDWAEKHLGPGGSYSAWKLFGVITIILGFLYAIGQFNVTPQDAGILSTAP